MGDFPEEESPWAQPLGASGFTETTGISPWAQPDEEIAGSPASPAQSPPLSPQPLRPSYEPEDVKHESPGPLDELTAPRTDDSLKFVPSESPYQIGGEAVAPTPMSSSRSDIRSRSSRRRHPIQSAKKEVVDDNPLSAPPPTAPDLDDVSLAPSTTLQDKDERVSEQNIERRQNFDGLMGFTRDDAKVSAPKPKFDVHVGDPSKVGDFSTAHTVYTINTSTDLDEYPQSSSSVTRRYRDFRWLYHALNNAHPGVIVPPPPEKQAVGRFNDDFIQQRRAALEKMLLNIVAHPILQRDPDLVAFLTADDFNEHLRTRVLSEEELEESSTWGSILGKGDEPDPWVVEKRSNLDTLDAQLRGSLKALDAINAQRKELSDAIGEFANVSEALANVQPTPRLGEVLRAFSEVHEQLSQLYSRQRQQDLLSLEASLDEHLRTIGSVRHALSARQRACSLAEQASLELEKKQSALDRILRQGKTQEDRMRELEAEVAKSSQDAKEAHDHATETTRLVDSEFVRIEKAKVIEFRDSMELYLETAVEGQKEAIELWETFYTRHFAKSS